VKLVDEKQLYKQKLNKYKNYMNNIFSWITNKITGKDTKNETQQPTLEEEMKAAIERCRAELRKCDDEIRDLRKWASEAIAKIFDIPQKNLFNEVFEYDEIKIANKPKNISEILIVKCDEIVAGYRQQIESRYSKIKLNEILLEKYRLALKKVEEGRKKLQQKNDVENKLSALDSHKHRLEALNENTDNLVSTFYSTSELQSFEEEMNLIEENFRFQEEYHRQLNELTIKYKTEETSFTNNDFKDEIDKIIQQLEKK